MLRSILFYAAFFFLLPFCSNAQATHKTVTITVVDAVTGKPVEGAEITFKAIIGKLTKKTNSEGKAMFDMYLLTKTQNWNYTVKTNNPGRSYKVYSGSVALTEGKDTYEYTASMQPDKRTVSFRISDEKQQPLSGATVKLKDDQGLESVSKSDVNGIADFDLVPASSYNNASLTISKEGLKEQTIPVTVNDKTSQVVVVVPSVATVITDTSGITMKKKVDLLEPTNNVTPTRMPPGYTVNISPLPVWGPYSPSCDGNPLARTPMYTSLAVEDEKTLFDNISSSCISAAGDAVDALVDMTENLASIASRTQALWQQEMQRKDPKFFETGQHMISNIQKIPQGEKDKTYKAIGEAVEKLSDMVDKMTKLAEGPELYGAKCLWEAVKNYASPDMNKLMKITGNFQGARDDLKEKMEQIKKRMADTTALNWGDKNLLSGWTDIQDKIGKTAEGLNLLLTYVSNPTKILPYEMQVNLAISTAEKMMPNLLNDCQVRECDRQIKQGILAAQASLVAARKLSAQFHKGESKWNRIITDYVTEHYKKEDRGWQYWPENDVRFLSLPADFYNTWVEYHNGAIKYDEEAVRLQAPLIKLGELCRKLQPIAATLNERVNKYELLYGKGLVAVEECRLKDAEAVVNELQVIENSACGHFFPKPYGKTKSEELKNKIKEAVQTGRCKEEGVDPRFAGKWYKCEGGYTIAISGSAANPSLLWQQDLGFWEKPNTWRVKDPRIFSNVKIEGNKITGRLESNPEYEEYLPGYELGKKKGKITGSFEFTLGHTSYGPDDERTFIQGTVVYDGDYCKGCTETWCFIRVKKW